MQPIRIILLCSSRFALPAIQQLAFYNQLAVVVIPTHCEEMQEQVTGILAGTGIPILLTDKDQLNKKLEGAIVQYEVNMGLAMAFSFKIPATVYSLPAMGFYNFHPGPLPRYRGADPVFWQLVNQEKQAGVTIHKIDEGMDTGPLVNIEMIHISKTDTHGILTSKLAQLSATMVSGLMKLAGFGITIPSKPQDESMAVYYKKQTAADISIDWNNMDADAIIALVNACNPWNKGAVTSIEHKIVRLLSATKPTIPVKEEVIPGTIISMDRFNMTVSTINKEAINISQVYLEEGFFTAESLPLVGLITGARFVAV